MHRNGLNIFLYTSDQPLDTVLFFTTTQQKLFWSSRFTGAHYNNCRSTGSTLEADTNGRLLYNFIRRGHSVHSDSWGQAKTNWVYHSLLWNRTKERKKRLKLFYTQCQADTEHLKMAIVHLSEDTRVDSLPLKDGSFSWLQSHRSLEKCGTAQLKTSDRITPRSSSLPSDVSSPQPGWCGDFCTTAILTFCPNTNHFENPIVECLHM